MNASEKRQFAILAGVVCLALTLPAIAAFWLAMQVIDAEPDALRLRLHEFHEGVLSDLASSAVSEVEAEFEAIGNAFEQVVTYAGFVDFVEKHPVEAVLDTDDEGVRFSVLNQTGAATEDSQLVADLKEYMQAGDAAGLAEYVLSLDAMNAKQESYDANGRDVLLDAYRYMAEAEQGLPNEDLLKYLYRCEIDRLPPTQFIAVARAHFPEEMGQAVRVALPVAGSAAQAATFRL